MKVLSINWGHCSTAALMVDGEVVGSASEERFSRIKNDERYPKAAIESILGLAGVNPSELDAVLFAEEYPDFTYILTRKYSCFTIEDNIREQQAYWYPRLYEGKEVSYLDVFKDKIDSEQYGGDWDKVLQFSRTGSAGEEKEFNQEFGRQIVYKHLGILANNVHFISHHRAHGYYAYYGSPLPRDKVLILTADAWGGDVNATVSLAEGSRIKLLSASDNLQVARLYRYITLLLGMKPDEHEYKVMGLAAYSKPEYFQGPYRVFKETQFVDGLGFAYNVKPPDLYAYFRERLEGYRFDAIAGALQQYTEDILVEWSRNSIKQTGATRVVFAGGAAMNVKALMQIAKMEEVDDLFVCPTPSDESTAIGAAYVFMHDHLLAQGKDPAKVLRPLPNAYLGAGVSQSDVKDTVRQFDRDPSYIVRKNVETGRQAQYLDQGKIVGRCVGRAEFGARALGNRSIIADPRHMRVIRKINEGVKSRDFWMPFAPTILAERADDYLTGRKGMEAPYMTQAFDTSPLAQHELIAGLHQGDFTCRPQILRREHNPAYYDLVSEFEKTTGVGGVLNTSFNLHGEPIVQTPQDAARVFKISGLDVLLLDGFAIEKAIA